MTGFGAGRGEAGGEAISVELRAVNGKFCEVKPRLPRELSSLEPEVAKTIRGRISRGVVEAFVRREAGGARGSVPHVDLALAAAYAKSFRELKDSLGLAGEPTVQDLAAMEGVISLGEAAPDLERASEALQAALGAGIDALDQMRRREGEALARDLSARLDTIEKGAREVARLAPLQVESVRDRLSTRIAELSRLASHLAQARGLVSSQAPAGRKLEFLVQELNREINTIGSKSQHAGIAGMVVELKAELERIREQVQNVE